MAATLYSGIGGFSPNMFWIERETDVNSSLVSGFYISLVVPLPGHNNTALCTHLSSHFKLQKLTLCRGVIKIHRSGDFRFIPLDITVQPWKQFQPFISGLLLLQSLSKVYKHWQNGFPSTKKEEEMWDHWFQALTLTPVKYVFMKKNLICNSFISFGIRQINQRTHFVSCVRFSALK